MWKTFFTQYRTYEEFDTFLNSIQRQGYTPVFIREQHLFSSQYGHYVECAVTAIKTRETK